MESGLAQGGFDIMAVSAASEALRVDDHDIALVDLGLPDGDGVELCRALRRRHPDRPIIVVTGRRDELDIVDALDAGADDYVTKPFSFAVLTLRIRRHSVACEPLELTAREFDLLTALAMRAGEPVSKDELMAEVWDTVWSKSTHTLAVHISSLRGKLSAAHTDSPTINTVAGVGYRIDADPSNR